MAKSCVGTPAYIAPGGLLLGAEAALCLLRLLAAPGAPARQPGAIAPARGYCVGAYSGCCCAALASWLVPACWGHQRTAEAAWHANVWCRVSCLQR